MQSSESPTGGNSIVREVIFSNTFSIVSALNGGNETSNS